MDDINPREFRRPGTAEYVLAKAGFISVEVTRDADIIQPGEQLVKLFGDKPVPPLESVVPKLKSLVFAGAYNSTGYLDGGQTKAEAMASLKADGATQAGMLSLDKILAEAAQAAKQDYEKSKQLRR